MRRGSVHKTPPNPRAQRLPDEGWAQRTWQPDTEHHGKTADLVFQSDPLADQLLASDDQRTACAGSDFT